MQLTTPLFVTALLSAVATTLAVPTGSDPFQFLSVRLKLSGGPASYFLDMKADGNVYYTNNALSINLISAASPSDLNIYYKCNFYTNGAKKIALAGGNTGSIVAVGPPQPVYGVACQPTSSLTGGCLPVYTTCSWSSDQGGTFLSSCCSGYCAASKCRATT